MVLEHSYITNESEARVSVPGSQRNAFQAMVEQHPYTRTITNVELRAGVSITIIPGTMSTYKEYHELEDIAHSQARAGETPMSTCIMEIPRGT